jgi:hypothetical protein
MVCGIVGVLCLLTSIPAGLGLGLFGIVQMLIALRRGERVGLKAAAPVLVDFAVMGLGMVLVRLVSSSFARGRQLRRSGRVLLPDLDEGAAWTGCPMEPERDDAPGGLADQWRENGRTEHASVAAFARLTLDLMALGAPPSLVASANEDALDEIRHTELCFSLARALDGRSVSPAPFSEAQRFSRWPRPRRLALAELAVHSLVDGALHEGVSARMVARLARRAEVPAIRGLLREIAADEGKHSAHGWAVVEWCLAEGGSTVAAALLGAVAAIPESMESPLPEGAEGGGWEGWGIHGRRLEAGEYSAARRHVVDRVHGLLGVRAA